MKISHKKILLYYFKQQPRHWRWKMLGFSNSTICYGSWDEVFYILLFLTVCNNSVMTKHEKNQVFQHQATQKSVVFVKKTFFFFCWQLRSMATAVGLFYSAQTWEGLQEIALKLGGTHVLQVHSRVKRLPYPLEGLWCKKVYICV